MAEDNMNSEPPADRRSVTMPIRLSESSAGRRGSSASIPGKQDETLFEHPSVRIVAFSTASPATRRASSSQNTGADQEEEEGTLPWSSSMERTIAVGPLRIYRAPGSVAFLNCGKVVQAILPKSRCWCVDDASSKFVLQKRAPQYWRIELPVATADDLRKVQEFRDILSQILLFERTVCPFQRSFSVELPEAPKTPVKKRPWRPVERPPKSEQRPLFPPVAIPETQNGEDYYSALSDDSHRGNDLDSDSDSTYDSEATPRNLCPRFGDDTAAIPESIQTGRSVTAPPQLTLITSPPSRRVRNTSPLRRSTTVESESDLSSSVESFHSVQSWHSPITPLPPSPPLSNPGSPKMYPYPHDNIALPKRPMHSRDVSEITMTAETTQAWQSVENDASVRESPSLPGPSTTTPVNDIEDNLDEEHFEIALSPVAKKPVHHRPTTGSNSRRRELSPLPPAANLFSPPRRRPSRLKTAQHLPVAIIKKTCEILLSPPSHLIHLVLEMASKVAAGEWRGMVYGFGEGGEKIVGQWDYHDGEPVREDWGEDDYGISVDGTQDMRRREARDNMEGSWEID